MIRSLVNRDVLLILIMSSLFLGCQKQYPVAEKLLQAETVMNEHPDSALHLLKGIEQPELHSKEHRARYALLYSQALLMEGMLPDNPVELAQKLAQLMAK